MSQELFDKAVCLEEAGKNQEALAIWQELAKTNPTRNVFLRLASVTKYLGFKDEAERAFERALEIDERSAHALKGLGILALDAADYKAAVEYLRRASAIEEDPGGFSLLGVALKNIGESLEAEAAFRRAIRIDPDYEEAYFNLATLFTQDRPSEAHALLRKAIELDPSMLPRTGSLDFF